VAPAPLLELLLAANLSPYFAACPACSGVDCAVRIVGDSRDHGVVHAFQIRIHVNEHVIPRAGILVQ
jgi:hypothetical protein